MDKERYKRAYDRFLADNPNIDMEKAEEEFKELYENGLYKLNDDYERAEELYHEASNGDNLEEVLALLKEAYTVCPYHYDSKILAVLIENKDSSVRVDKLEEVREEYKRWLKTKDIDLDTDIDDIWTHLESKAYIRLLSTLVDECINSKRYNDARKYSEMEYRLDKDNLVDSLFDYLLCILLNEKYSLAVKLINEHDNTSSRYLILLFYAYIGLKDYKKAIKTYNQLYRTNPYYCAFIVGILEIDDEEFERVMHSESFEHDSYEEAIYFINRIIVVVEMLLTNLNEFYTPNFVALINKLISLPKAEILIITSALTKDGLTITEITNILKEENLYLDDAHTKGNLNSLIRKKYIYKFNKKYYVTELSYFIARMAISDSKTNNNNKEEA